MTRMPVMFLPHGGGPCFFMEWNPPDTWDRMAAFLRSVRASLPEEPSAVLVISGHWEEEVVTVRDGGMGRVAGHALRDRRNASDSRCASSTGRRPSRCMRPAALVQVFEPMENKIRPNRRPRHYSLFVHEGFAVNPEKATGYPQLWRLW